MGAQVGEGVRQFVETGSADSLEKEAASWTFLDSVLAPPILQGGGREDTTLFLDGNHSQVEVGLGQRLYSGCLRCLWSPKLFPPPTGSSVSPVLSSVGMDTSSTDTRRR